MNTICKFATLALMMFAASVYGFSQKPPKASGPENLERGIVGPVTSNGSWSGYSTVALIPGAGLIPVTNTNTVFYLGFTAGTEADISNMVLYTTARGSSTITAVTPITLGGVSNPSIMLSDASVCPIVEISAVNPCIVRLDPTKLTLSALSDYYLAVYFTADDSHNGSLGLTAPQFGQSSLRGSYETGDQTQLGVGGSIPSSLNFASQPYSLMYVMND